MARSYPMHDNSHVLGFAAAAALFVLTSGDIAHAQVMNMAPKPLISALDDMGVDLKSGSIIRQMGSISIGPADAPVLDYSILSTSFVFAGRTPVYGTLSRNCVTYSGVPGCVYSQLNWTLQGSSENYLESPASTTSPRGFTEQGSIVSGSTLIRKDGSVWQFGDGDNGSDMMRYGLIGVLSSITYPNGEVLTYNYSGGQLRSVVSNTGFMMHFENFKPYVGQPTKVVLINLKRDYCAPLATSCTGLTLNWPSVTFAITSPATDVIREEARDNVNRVASRTTTTTLVTDTSGLDQRTATMRFTTPAGRWIEFQRLNSVYKLPTTGGVTCDTRSILQWARTLAGQWNYTFPGSDECRFPRVSSGISTGPDGATQKWDAGFVDALNRKTLYGVKTFNNYFGGAAYEISVDSITKPEGNKFTFYYDERENLESTRAASKSGSEQISSSAKFGPTSGCTAATAKTCNQPEYSLDANGNRIDYTYYAEHGGVETKTLPPDANGVRPQLRYTYEQKSARYKNASGALINGSPIWKLSKISQCKEGTTCVGTENEIITTYGYNDNLLPITQTVKTGGGTVLSVTTKVYDDIGNVVEVDGPLAGDIDKVYAFYDDARQKIGEIGVDPDGTGPLLRIANRTTYNADGQVRLVESGTTNGTTRAHLDSMTVVRYADIEYDGLGRAVRESVVAGGATQGVKQHSHDVRGKVVCTAVRMNASVYGSLPTDACALSVQGSYGPDRITKNVYNAAGELVQIIQGYGTADQRVYATYGYSDNGSVVDSIDANGNRTHLTYDGFDRLDTTYYPSSTRATAFDPSTPANALASAGAYSTTDFEKLTYDNNGNRKTWRRRDGAVIGFDYDGLDRQILKDIPTGTAEDVHTGYDLLGNVSWRRFASRTGSGVSYVTDGLGRVTSTTDLNGRTVGYKYNAASAKTRLTFPEGQYIEYTLDNANRMTHFGWNAPSGLYSQSYTSLGQLYSMTKGSGTTGFNYHAIGTLASVSNDLAGTANDITWSFPTYNPAGQVVTQNSSSESYDYLEAAVTATNKNYDGLNRDAGIASLPRGYDARGNLTHDGTRTFTYDLENRLRTATGGSANLELVYDPEGRVSKYRSGATETTFLYDGVNLIAEYNSSGMLLRRYVHGTGVDNPLVWLEGTDAANRRYFYTNYQGSVIAYADAAGNRQAMYKYGPYGEPKDANNSEAWTGARFRYTGQMMLPEAKLYFYKARAYDPDLGRFLQTDPIGTKDDLNLYAYVKNDPVNAKDPTGKFVFIIPAIGYGLTALESAIFVSTAVVAGIGAGVVINEASDSNAAAPDAKPDAPASAEPKPPAARPDAGGRSRSNPIKGEPGSAKETQTHDGQPKQTREYGADGYPERDIDHDHDHGQGKPHVHDWTRPADGSPPTSQDRQPGRPPREGEIEKARGKCVDPTKGCLE